METDSRSKIDVDVPLVASIVIVSALLLLVTGFAVDGWYKSQEAEFVATKWDKSPNTWLDGLRAQERANLQINHRINRFYYHVPISEGMKILVQSDGKLP